MLPPGHIAAGFLTAKALLKIIQPNLPVSQLNQLLGWGAFFAFAPDLDSFWTFYKEKAFTVRKPKENDHRGFISHAPVLWLLAGLLIYFLAQSEYVKILGLLLWLCSWSHFLLDSIEHGIMWLWPLRKKRYALRAFTIFENRESSFFAHWWNFLKMYFTRVSFYLEIIVIVTALIIYFK